MQSIENSSVLASGRHPAVKGLKKLHVANAGEGGHQLRACVFERVCGENKVCRLRGVCSRRGA